MKPFLCKPFLGVFDGSCKPTINYAPFGWALGDKDGNIFYRNGGAVGGISRDQTSFRPEEYAAFGCLSFIRTLEDNGWDVSTERKYFSDNKETTNTPITTHIPPSKKHATIAHFDIRTQLSEELDRAHVKCPIQHVKGHMDRKKHYEDCSPQEKMNIKVETNIHPFTTTSSRSQIL